MFPDKLPSGDEIMVALKLLNVLPDGTELLVLATIPPDEGMVGDMLLPFDAEDMLPPDNEALILLRLTFNVELTEVMLRLYGILSFSGQSKLPHPSMVVFLINRKGRPASAHCSRESEMLLEDEMFNVMLMAVLGNKPTYSDPEGKISNNVL